MVADLLPWVGLPHGRFNTTTGSLWKQSKPFRQCDGGYLQRLGSAVKRMLFLGRTLPSLIAEMVVFLVRKNQVRKSKTLNTKNGEWMNG